MTRSPWTLGLVAASACLLSAGLHAAPATPPGDGSPPGDFTHFVNHPTYCAAFLGGADHANDGVPGDYAEALARALAPPSKETVEAMSRLRRACVAKSAR